MLGELISAGTSLLGGLFGQNAAQKERGIQLNAANSLVQNRVKDSLAAGIHPLFGLGASVSSPAPVVTGQAGEGLREAGQNIGRAVEAYASASERAVNKQVQALQMRRMGLENTLIEEQIRSERNRSVGSPPAFPEQGPRSKAAALLSKVVGQGDGKVDEVNPQRTTNLKVGLPYETNPNFTDAQTIEDRYGDSEILSMLSALVTGGADAWHNYAKSPYRWDRATKRIFDYYVGRHSQIGRRTIQPARRNRGGN